MESIKSNITLIGMPGAGKSTVGVLLAKTTGRDFIDTDILIQNQQGALLPLLIDQYGFDGFIELESQAVQRLHCRNAVIAPGGSVVYSEGAMARLRDISKIYYLQLSLENLSARLENITARGVLLRPGQDLASLYRERIPLYERYCDETIRCDGKNSEEILQELLPV